jgi:hypothetical protein
MTGESDNGLSRLARELLVAERSAAEPEALKRRALARARAAYAAELAGAQELVAVPREWRVRHRRRSVSVVLAAAAALAIGGMAAAQVGWWETPSTPGAPSRIMRPPLRAFRPHAPTTQRAVLPTLEQTSSVPAPASAPRSAARLPMPSSRVATEAPKTAAARQYAAELALLEPARSALARGDNAAALSAIVRHEREFEAGFLAEERSALRVRALWGMGRISEAEAAAKAFRARYPRSALLGWMKSKREP